MCDTVVVTGEATADGYALFGKNSDREPNEAHQLVRVPARDHAHGSRLRCTHIEIPQVKHTYAVLLAKPFWTWGAEMGANEHGVVIGNEAVFTKVPYRKQVGLIGMDLLRLALERAPNARQAMHLITDLLAEYGQGGNHGYQAEMFYHNSFLIADPNEAWVLETAGPHWAAKRVRGVYTISNALTIGADWDLASPDLVSHAIQQGWCESTVQFSFARCYSDSHYTTLYDGDIRRARTTDILNPPEGDITLASVMATMRDHGEKADERWSPDKARGSLSVCFHAGHGEKRGSQTTGSMVSHLHPQCATHFLTGTAAPCTSIYKPLWLDGPLPDMGPPPKGSYDPDSLFWRHEGLHRRTLLDFADTMQFLRPERDVLEQRFIQEALDRAQLQPAARADFVERCFAESDRVEARWLQAILEVEAGPLDNSAYAQAWLEFNRKAGMPF